MRKKRLLTIAAMAMIVVTSLSFTAFAYPVVMGSEVLYASAYGGATVSTKSIYKSNKASSMLLQAGPSETGGWSSRGNEYVYFRGRTGDYVKSTDLLRLNYSGKFRNTELYYINGYSKGGIYHRIAIEYDNSNPYQYVKLLVNWTP